MTKKQTEKINMYGTVLRQFENDPSIFENFPVLKEFENPFKKLYDAIREAGQRQSLGNSGITIYNSNQKKGLAIEISHLANSLYSWASHNNDPVVQSKADINQSTLEKLIEPTFCDTCNEIIKHARPYLGQLAGFGITSDSLTEIEDKVKAYNTSLPERRNLKSETVFSKSELKKYFKDADSILKQRFDKVMKRFKQTNIAVYEVYANNRKLVRQPVTTTQIRGAITSTEAPKGIRNVAITLVETGGKKYSSGEGKFSFRPVTPGSYSLQFTADNYQPLTITGYTAKIGQLNRLQVSLEKIPVAAV